MTTDDDSRHVLHDVLSNLTSSRHTSERDKAAKNWLISGEESPQLMLFPKTRYFGSKRAQLPWLFESFRELKFRSALDAFGGTGSVSLLLSAMGKKVTFNDALLSNVIGAKALLHPLPQSLNAQAMSTHVSAIVPVRGTIAQKYRGYYFTDAENCWLDGFCNYISGIKDVQTRNVLLHCLFQSCLKKRPFNLFHRRNLSLRIQCPENSRHGNHYSWNATFEKHMLGTFSDLRGLSKFQLEKANVLRAGDADRIAPGYDLVYLDPPYIPEKKTIDSYHRLYHFLQGLCMYNAWASNINESSSIRELKEPPFLEAWHRKNTFKERLFSLIERHSNSIVVLSYASPGYPSARELGQFFRDTFSSVKIVNRKYRTVLSKDMRTEKLFIGRP